MNIVYALSGEGRGHSSLARAILPVLQRAGHRLRVVTYGQSLAPLADYDPLPIRGIRHHYDPRGRLSLARTFFGNRGVLPWYAAHWGWLRRQLRAFAPDLCIVNFEPFTPLVARSLRIPVLSFDNQHALLHDGTPAPRGSRWCAWFTKTAIRCVAPGADEYVVMAFAPPAVASPRVHVVPPVVQDEFRRLRPTVGEHVLVYLKHPHPRFLAVLQQTGRPFLVYGYSRAAVDGNLTYRVFSDAMPGELAASRAVMGTAGMSLVSEAVWLRKPFFGVPLKNEFEQHWNARQMREADFGDFAEEPSRAEIELFFARLDRHRRALQDYRYDADAAGAKLLELIDRRQTARGQSKRGPGS